MVVVILVLEGRYLWVCLHHIKLARSDNSLRFMEHVVKVIHCDSVNVKELREVQRGTVLDGLGADRKMRRNNHSTQAIIFVFLPWGNT